MKHASRGARAIFFAACSVAIGGAIFFSSRAAHAQACCAGSGAVTPGRLALHEWALVGAVVKAQSELGSYDGNGNYAGSPASASVLSFEEDVFGAVRFLNRGQVAVLVPIFETNSKVVNQSEFGGGIGDINVSGRWDFTLAGASRVLPGIAALAGVTFPTGKTPEDPSVGPLGTGATGVGAFQVNAGLAVEQSFGPWLVSLSGFAAQRFARTVGSGSTQVHERLGVQWTTLAAAAYIFRNDVAVALSASYIFEGDNTINGLDAPNSGKRLPTLTAGVVVPITDVWRVQNAIFYNLPISQLGLNEPSYAGFSTTIVRSWL